MGTSAQPDLIENVGKVNPPHCGHIRPPLLGMLVGGVGSGRGCVTAQIEVTIFVGTALSDTYTGENESTRHASCGPRGEGVCTA